MRDLFDKIVLACIRRRLDDFRTQKDSSDRFADKIIALLQDEIQRRNRLYDGWDKKRQREIELIVDEARRQMAQERFERLE